MTYARSTLFLVATFLLGCSRASSPAAATDVPDAIASAPDAGVPPTSAATTNDTSVGAAPAASRVPPPPPPPGARALCSGQETATKADKSTVRHQYTSYVVDGTTMTAAKGHYLGKLPKDTEVVSWPPHGPAAIQNTTLRFGRDQSVDIFVSSRAPLTNLQCPAAKSPDGILIATTGVFLVVREPAP